MFVVFAVITVLRFRRGRLRDPPGAGFLDRLEAEEPLLRPMVAELRAYGSLFLVIGGRRRIAPGATPFGYTKGTMTIPAVLVGMSLVELAVVHVLVPWPWLRIVLLFLSVWGVLFILGFFATRVAYPHFVADDVLHLRWGHQAVLATPLANIVSAARHSNHSRTQPHAEGTRLILTQFESTNVVIRFSEPVAAAAPVSKKQLPADFHASEVHLYVDDPETFLRAVRPSSESVAT